jgi:copper resistance protein B
MAERLCAFALAWCLAGEVRAAEPLPPVTAEARAAAFPDVSHADMAAHMHEDPLTAKVAAERFEWQDRDDGDALAWDVTAWLGRNDWRVWLRDEGEKASGEQAENELELLWGRPVAAWWDLLAGVRHDTAAGPSRTYAAVGVHGLAPQWLEVEATAYLGERGQAGLNVEAGYHWLLTNRLVASARVEADAWTRDDEANALGSGLAQIEAGLRVRYEIRRELAPYAGFEWSGLAGDTADLARAAGDPVRDGRWVAGVRFWF